MFEDNEAFSVPTQSKVFVPGQIQDQDKQVEASEQKPEEEVEGTEPSAMYRKYE